MLFIGNSICESDRLIDMDCGGLPFHQLIVDMLTADGWDIQKRVMAHSGYPLVHKEPGESRFHCDNVSDPADCVYRSFEPDIVVEMVGTNDAHLQTDYPLSEWVSDSVFALELRRLIDTILIAGNSPDLYLCLPPPLWDFGKGAQHLYSDTLLTRHIHPVIRQVASERSLKTIDMHTPLSDKPELFPDGVHPNCAAHEIMADAGYAVITNQSTSASGKLHFCPDSYNFKNSNAVSVYDYKGRCVLKAQNQIARGSLFKGNGSSGVYILTIKNKNKGLSVPFLKLN